MQDLWKLEGPWGGRNSNLSSLAITSCGFLLGMVVVLAEPAVYVLTEQVEDVTAGHIKRELY